MVSTRNHPGTFPPDATSPGSGSASESPSQARRRKTTSTTSSNSTSLSSRNAASGWSHTPSNLFLLWLVISLPLVTWDFVYVFLRPHSMPGGKWHSPIWTPYAIYGVVDHTYGFVSYDAKDGFVGAQSAINVIETLMYTTYLALVWHARSSQGKSVRGKVGRGAPKSAGWLARPQPLVGAAARWAVLLGFSTSVMTLSKTALYWLREYFSSFASVAHNDATTLFVYYIVPNSPWLILPGYMTYVFGAEILQALEQAQSG